MRVRWFIITISLARQLVSVLHGVACDATLWCHTESVVGAATANNASRGRQEESEQQVLATARFRGITHVQLLCKTL